MAASRVSGRTPIEPTTRSAGRMRSRRPGRTDGLGDLGDGRPRGHLDAVGHQLGLHQHGELGVERGEHLGGGLDHGHGDAGVAKVLRRLQADEPGPDDHGGARGGRRRRRPGVGRPRRFAATGPARSRGWAAGPETAPGLSTSLSKSRADSVPSDGGPHGEPVAAGVDGHDLAVDPDVEAEPLVELRGGLEEQVVLVLDDPADEVGKSAVGVGDVARAFEHHDLGGLVEPAQAGGGRHAAGHPTHDHHPARARAGHRAGRIGPGIGRGGGHGTHPDRVGTSGLGEHVPFHYTPGGTKPTGRLGRLTPPGYV